MGQATVGLKTTENPDIKTASRYKQDFGWADETSVQIMLGALRLQSARNTAMTRFFETLGSVRSAGRYTLLRILFFSDEDRLTQIEIVNAMQVTSPNVTYLIDALEKEGLVARTPHPTDRRVTYVELTPTGRDVCGRLIPAMVDFMGAMTEGFSEDEKVTFYNLLDRYRQNYEDYAVDD
jgi:DNA-binding MarR family transcriptional regulator